MYFPKHDIYTSLKTIANVPVYQRGQKTIVEAPAVTYFISDNNNRLNLENKIAAQDIEATIDIWAENSTKADAIFEQVEIRMRMMGYRLSYSTDVPDPDNICHINTRFTGLKTKEN